MYKTKLTFLFLLSATLSYGSPKDSVRYFYFRFPENYVNALYNNIGRGADENNSGISIKELKSYFEFQVTHQPQQELPKTDSIKNHGNTSKRK